MEHGIGSGSIVPDCQGRLAEGVMVRRLSVASLDSGAESPVYGEEPSASAGRLGPVGTPPWSGAARRTDWKGVLATQPPGFFQAYASGGQTALGRCIAPGAARAGLGGEASPGGIAAPPVPRGGATRGITVSVKLAVPGQVGTAAARLATTYDKSVVDRQSGRWYVKDICASTQPRGTQ